VRFAVGAVPAVDVAVEVGVRAFMRHLYGLGQSYSFRSKRVSWMRSGVVFFAVSFHGLSL